MAIVAQTAGVRQPDFLIGLQSKGETFCTKQQCSEKRKSRSKRFNTYSGPQRRQAPHPSRSVRRYADGGHERPADRAGGHQHRNNAIKHTPEGSHITLSAKKSNRRVITEIADDGPGISDEAKKKLFDMFCTANNKRVDGRWGVLSARSDDRDKVAALDAGADDYAFYADMQKREETLLKMQQRRICTAIDKAYCLSPDVYVKRYAWYCPARRLSQTTFLPLSRLSPCRCHGGASNRSGTGVYLLEIAGLFFSIVFSHWYFSISLLIDGDANRLGGTVIQKSQSRGPCKIFKKLQKSREI